MRVVAVTGMPGSGKGLATEVADKLGVRVVSMGDLVRAETEARGLPPEPASYGEVASDVREKEGLHAWATRTLASLDLPIEGTLLIDGVRNLEEVAVFRTAFGDAFVLVAVVASPSTRYDRMLKRQRAEDADDPARLRERDLREIGYGLGGAIAMADVTIDNEGDADATRARLRQLLSSEA